MRRGRLIRTLLSTLNLVRYRGVVSKCSEHPRFRITTSTTVVTAADGTRPPPSSHRIATAGRRIVIESRPSAAGTVELTSLPLPSQAERRRFYYSSQHDLMGLSPPAAAVCCTTATLPQAPPPLQNNSKMHLPQHRPFFPLVVPPATSARALRRHAHRHPPSGPPGGYPGGAAARTSSRSCLDCGGSSRCCC